MDMLNMLYALLCFAAVGALNALMDTQMFLRSNSSLYRFFDLLELKEWFMATGGNKRWRKFVLVWDFWHVCKNLMWLAVGAGTSFVSMSGLGSPVWLFIVPPLIGGAFILVFHKLFKAPYE